MSTENTVDLFELDVEPRGREKSRFALLPRPDRSPAFVRYSAPGLSGTVYIHRSASEQMQKIALETAPNETIGMLCGRPCTDEHGDYTLVMAVERALPGEYVGTPGSVRISTAGRAALKARAAQRWAGWEDVGWYHTHPRGEPRFSPTDFDEQSTLLAHQVGIVASVDRYMSGRGDPLGVYLGPTGHRLSGAQQPRNLNQALAPPTKKDDIPRRYFTPEMRKQIQIGAVAIVALLVVSQALTAAWVRGAVKDQYAAASNTFAATPVAATPVAAPTPKVITRTRRVVRLTPALLGTRRCNVGDHLAFGVRVPQAFRDGLAVEAVDPGIVAVAYNPGAQRVSVDCLAVGDTVVEMRHGVSGAAASVSISVDDPMIGVQP